MKRIVIGIIVVILLAVAAAVAVRARVNRTAQPPVLPPVQASTYIEAEGRAVPVHGVSLGFMTGGTVGENLVAAGDRVQPGQPLVRLVEARQAAAAVAQAEANLRRASARLAELRAGVRPQEVESARSALEAVEARYAQVRAGARPEERTQARLQVEQAEGQAAAARQRVVQAEAALLLAEDELRRTEQLLGQGALAVQAVAQARTRVLTARANLEAARADYATAGAQAAAARQQLQLVLTGPRAEEVAAAAAEVRRAQAQLALVAAGVRPETLEAARADVAAAAATVRASQATLAQTELRAPIAGIVVFIGPRVGEAASPGIPVVRVADVRAWQIETTDLTELSIVRVRPGDRVTVRLDAIPDLELAGRVTAIEAFGENRQGDITYRVRIALDQQDSRIRWNMTATVMIGARPELLPGK